MAQDTNSLLRIGVFYDGTYFSHVSNYYLYAHERKARISINGLHEFIREQVASEEGRDRRFCQIVDAHYFRGRLSTKAAADPQTLLRERQFEDVLIREGITQHLLPLASDRDGDIQEKGIDVWFALEAYELAYLKRFEVLVLITGDSDFVPLVRKLNTLGTRVMLLAWDFEYQREDRSTTTTRASQALINEVTYPIMMHDEIDSRGRKKDASISHLFVSKREDQGQSGAAAGTPVVPVAIAGTPAAMTDEAAAPLREAAPSGRQSGAVANLVVGKGFGFVRPDVGGPNLFFHMNSVADGQFHTLQIGTAVTYDVVNTERGLNAVSVRVTPPNS